MTFTLPGGTIKFQSEKVNGRYPAVGAGDGTPASGGTAALSWSAPEGLGDGKKLVIETDGTNDFGPSPDYSKSAYLDLRGLSAGDPAPQPQNYFDFAAGEVVENHGLVEGKSVPVFNTPETAFNGSFRIEDVNGPHGYEVFDEVFFTYTQRVPNDDQIDGLGNQKPFWLMLGDRGDNWCYANITLDNPPQGHDLYVIGASGQSTFPNVGTIIGGNNVNRMSGDTEVLTSPDNGWDRGNLVTDSFYTKLDPVTPTDPPAAWYAARTGVSIGTDVATTALEAPIDDKTSKPCDGTDYNPQDYYNGVFGWDRIEAPGFYNTINNHDQQVYMSAMYICAGANSFAHVSAQDSSDETASTKRVIAKPLTWAANKIEVEVNQGNLTDLSGSVLHIRKGNGSLLTLELT